MSPYTPGRLVLSLIFCAVLAPSKDVLGQTPASSSALDVSTEIQKSDPRVDNVLDRANDHFRKGKFCLEDNKRELARDEFDKAIDEILVSGLDVRASQRLQAGYLELVEKIYREELKLWPPLPSSERIKNPLKSDDLYIPPTSLNAPPKLRVLPQESTQDSDSKTNSVTKIRARKGDTIAKIAAARNLSADELSKLNGIASNVQLDGGQEIKLPIVRSQTALGELRSSYINSIKEYKASLEKLLTLYQASEKKAEDRLAQTKKLFAENLLFQSDLDRAQRTVDDAKAKVVEARVQITTAENQIKQAEDELRQQQIALARDRDRADELIGSKPMQSANGTIPIVTKWFQDHLHDPYSAKYLHWSKIMKGFYEGEPYWIVSVRLRAKNAFNAYRLSDYVFYIRRNRVVYFNTD